MCVLPQGEHNSKSTGGGHHCRTIARVEYEPAGWEIKPRLVTTLQSSPLRRKLNTISIQQKSIHSTTNEISVFKGGLFFSGTGLGTGSGTGQELELEEGRHHFYGRLRCWSACTTDHTGTRGTAR